MKTLEAAERHREVEREEDDEPESLNDGMANGEGRHETVEGERVAGMLFATGGSAQNASAVHAHPHHILLPRRQGAYMLCLPSCPYMRRRKATSRQFSAATGSAV